MKTQHQRCSLPRRPETTFEASACQWSSQKLSREVAGCVLATLSDPPLCSVFEGAKMRVVAAVRGFEVDFAKGKQPTWNGEKV